MIDIRKCYKNNTYIILVNLDIVLRNFIDNS